MANLTQKVAWSTGAQIVGRLLQMVLGLVSVGILARVLGISGYGDYSIVFAYAAFAATFADFGSTQLIVREASQERAPLEELLGSGFVVSAAFGAIVFLGFAITLIALPYSPTVKLGSIIALSGVIIGNLNIYGSYFTYRVRQDVMVFIETLGRTISVGLLIWLVAIKAPFLWIVAASPISLLFNAVFGTALVLRNRIRPRFNRDRAIWIFKHSLPLGLVAVLGLIHFKIDAIILSLMKSSSDVAIYSLAYKVVELLVIIPGFFVGAVYPVLASAFRDRKEFDSKAQLVLDFTMVIGLPSLVGAFLVAPQIIDLLGSADFHPAILPLRILIFAVFFNYLMLFHNIIAVSANLQRKIIPVLVTSVVVNVLANLVLIPVYSYNGAAIATIISEATGVALVFNLINREIGLKRSFGRLPLVALASAIMGLVLLVLGSRSLFIVVPIGAVVYAASLLLLRGVKRDELKLLLGRA